MLAARMFKYIYYRINRFYFNWDGRRGATSLVGLSFSQFSWIMVFFMVLYIFYLHDQQWIDKEAMKYIFCGSSVLLIFVNYRIHDGKYNEYKRIWANETKGQFYVRGILVILFILVPFFLFPLIINCL